MDWTVVAGILGVWLLAETAIQIGSVFWILPFFEIRPPFCVEPTAPDPQAERIRFPTSGGLQLEGSLYRQTGRPPLGLIIFCHEFGGNQWSVMSYCEALWRAGFDILAFDFRNHGDSDVLPGYSPMHWLTEHEVADAAAAVRYVQQREDLRRLPLGMMGVSRGGCAALAAAARIPEVCGVACDGMYSTHSLMIHYFNRWASLYVPRWFLDIRPKVLLRITLTLVRWVSERRQSCRYVDLERRLPQLRNRPLLLIAGESDSYAPHELTKSVCRAAGLSDYELWTVPRAKHNLARQVDRRGYDARLVEFFTRTLSAAPTENDRAERKSSANAVGQI